MSDVPKIVTDVPVRFFKRDLDGFALEGKGLFGKVSRKAYELSIPKALDRPQGDQPPLNACLLILRNLKCERKGRGAQLEFQRVIDEKGQLADEKVKKEDRNLPSSCVPCYVHPGETCHPYHDYDGDSGVKAGQVHYILLSNRGKPKLSVESVSFVCALIMNSDEGRRIRYENVQFPPVPPKEAGTPDRVGFRMEETSDGYKAWGELLPSRNGQATFPWSLNIELRSGGHRPSDVAFLYLWNVQTPSTQHGHIRCTMGEEFVGEQTVGPDCNSPLIFDFSDASSRVFDKRINLELESKDTKVVVKGNIEPFFVTV